MKLRMLTYTLSPSIFNFTVPAWEVSSILWCRSDSVHCFTLSWKQGSGEQFTRQTVLCTRTYFSAAFLEKWGVEQTSCWGTLVSQLLCN